MSSANGAEGQRPVRVPGGVRVALALSAVLVTLAAALVLISRAMYDEWPWSSKPIDTLHVCGRSFIDQGPMSRAQIAANGDRLRRIGSVPGWLNHDQLWTTSVGTALAGHTCHDPMYVRTGADVFETYVLSGGP